MKKACTFTPATTHFGFLRDSSKHPCLNKPGRAGFSPHGGTGVASQPPIGHYFFSPFTATLHHVTQTFSSRPGNHSASRKANYPPAFTPGRTRYAPRFDAIAARIPAVFEAPKRQARTAPAEDGLKADYLPLYSSYFINLQCVSTVKR